MAGVNSWNDPLFAFFFFFFFFLFDLCELGMLMESSAPFLDLMAMAGLRDARNSDSRTRPNADLYLSKEFPDTIFDLMAMTGRILRRTLTSSPRQNLMQTYG